MTTAPRLSKQSAAAEFLVVTKDGYLKKHHMLAALDQAQNVVLTSSAKAAGNMKIFSDEAVGEIEWANAAIYVWEFTATLQTDSTSNAGHKGSKSVINVATAEGFTWNGWAFHVAKPSDLIPELQGRFPIRVELEPLTKEDFVRILTEPENALIRQYVELLRTERVSLRFLPEAVEAIAEIAMQVNTSTENIGARRLYTIMERLLDEISFDAPDMPGKELTIDAEYVRLRLSDVIRDQDLSRYIL